MAAVGLLDSLGVGLISSDVESSARRVAAAIEIYSVTTCNGASRTARISKQFGGYASEGALAKGLRLTYVPACWGYLFLYGENIMRTLLSLVTLGAAVAFVAPVVAHEGDPPTTQAACEKTKDMKWDATMGKCVHK